MTFLQVLTVKKAKRIFRPAFEVSEMLLVQQNIKTVSLAFLYRSVFAFILDIFDISQALAKAHIFRNYLRNKIQVWRI